MRQGNLPPSSILDCHPELSSRIVESAGNPPAYWPIKDELTVHKNKCVFFVFSKYWLYHFALASMNFFWAMNDCGSYGPSSRPPLSGGGSTKRAASGFVLHWKRWDPFLSNSARCSPHAAIFCHRI